MVQKRKLRLEAIEGSPQCHRDTSGTVSFTKSRVIMKVSLLGRWSLPQVCSLSLCHLCGFWSCDLCMIQGIRSSDH